MSEVPLYQPLQMRAHFRDRANPGRLVSPGDTSNHESGIVNGFSAPIKFSSDLINLRPITMSE